MQPDLIDKDIPHRQLVADEIHAKALKVKQLLSETFKGIDSRISSTFDSSTSQSSDPYLTMTAHWINSDFKLFEQVIAFREIIGNHSGENTGQLLVELLNDYNICSSTKVCTCRMYHKAMDSKLLQLGWLVADNATTCDAAVRHVAHHVDPSQKVWKAKERRGRCMEHAVHCATRAFVEAVQPSPIHRVKKALGAKAAKSNASSANDAATSELSEEDYEGLDADLDELSEEELDELESKFGAKDLLGKILAFVNQVRASPQARTYFNRVCKQEEVAPLQLLKWVRTRWASLYDLIVRISKLRKVRKWFNGFRLHVLTILLIRRAINSPL